MASLKTDCRKFAPNIFNKSKCQNCFRAKDVHSAEALESNRATRKVCLCGYLFVAPDWDFSLPANRNKRWQRRWFILYDDGELAYSVDECPETVPQAIIDMNCVLEVTDAESITGNQYALAITLPEKVHFIKGTSKEERRKWFEVLSRFPKNTVCGKYKRNATFPGIKATSAAKSENNFTDWINRRDTVEVNDYTKCNGYARTAKKQNFSVPFDPEDDVIPTKDTCSGIGKDYEINTQLKKETCVREKPPLSCRTSSRDIFALLNSSSLKTSCSQNEANKRSESSQRLTPKARDLLKEKLLSEFSTSRKYLRQDDKAGRKLHTRSDVTPMIPSILKDKNGVDEVDWKRLDIDSLDYRSKNYHNNPVYVLMSDITSEKKYDSSEKLIPTRSSAPHQQNGFSRRGDLAKENSSWMEDSTESQVAARTLQKSASVPNASILSDEKKKFVNGSIYSSQCSSKGHNENKYPTDHNLKISACNALLVRGDPDGCNLDSLPSCFPHNTEMTEQNSEAFSLKKGWLVKQEYSKWNKHWFVLRNSALAYYSDPTAESSGILDGMVDLRKVQRVSEVDSFSGFTFCILMKDNSNLYLSAVTEKMRTNWIRAIMQVAKLKGLDDSDATKKRNDKTLQMSHEHSIKESLVLSNMDSDINSSQKTHSKTTLEEVSHLRPHRTSVALPPSPPLARTAISRVKERARTRSHSRGRSSRYNSTEIHEPENYLADSDDGTTDHSSSSLSTTPVSLSKEKSNAMETETKSSHEKSRSERRRSLKLSSGDTLVSSDKKKKIFEIKDKLEDSSWTIWLDVSKFCKEVEAKLDTFEKFNNKEVAHRMNGKADECLLEQKKDTSHLVACLVKVEKRLHKVHNALEKAKVDLLLTNKVGDIVSPASKNVKCVTIPTDAKDISGLPDNHNTLLTQQLGQMKEENRRLKQDLKVAQASSDNFELKSISLKQEVKQKQELHQSQMDLMIARVDDLTTKLFNSEKNVRQLRQRVMKLEQRQERRRSSLKGKEALTLSKEYEAKLSELEQKIDAVEVAIKVPENNSTDTKAQEKDVNGKEAPSLLLRLHNLDKKVKDVTEIVDQCTVETKSEDFMKPEIRLQVKPDESSHNQDTNEGWNSLSLSSSMTDIPNSQPTDQKQDKNITLSFRECLEVLNYKATSLVSWLKTTLQLMCSENSSSASSNPEFACRETSTELEKLISAIEYVSCAIEQNAIIPKDINDIAEKLLYKIVLLQEITNIVFRMSNIKKYRATVLMQHLIRIKQTVLDLEGYVSQKSNVVNVSSPRMSICNIIANLLFYKVSLAPDNSPEFFDVEKLYEEVDRDKERVSGTVTLYKENFLQNFYTTMSELSENSFDGKLDHSQDKQTDTQCIGQKQFLSYINHIITQISESFSTYVSRSLNEMYFVYSDVQYNNKWTSYICKLLQRDLIQLSLEIKNVCIKNLDSHFYTGSKCGVLVEYMHCSIWELAQIVCIYSIVESTFTLIRDAMSDNTIETSNKILPIEESSNIQVDWNLFHQNLLQRTASIMSNLPLCPYFSQSWTFCNTSEVNVAYRSVSSLLCFKQKWKSAIESEKSLYRTQVEQMTQTLNALKNEQKFKEEICKSCVELKQEVSYLQGELDECQAVARAGNLCEKCNSLKQEIQKLMEQHERDTFILQKIDEQEKMWKQRTRDAIKEKEESFNQEKLQLQKQLEEVQGQMRTIGAQYDEDLQNLQKLYEQKLSQPQNDLYKGRYNEEIDQLKSLCEKGLEAMEASHKRVVAELELRHQKELDDLINEREKVLSEEAQATAVALEAVRKAHKEELQRQIELFKEEFVQKMKTRLETEAFKKGYETEISKIKHEILSITEKYSVKCLENISLQENLESVTEQLKLTSNQILELRSRNKQLQARLASESMQNLEELV